MTRISASRDDTRREILVYGDWAELAQISRVGTLYASPVRVQEVYEFHYDRDWLGSAPSQSLDPELLLFQGPQYPASDRGFGLFLDSAPDRWGRFLMDRREAQNARDEGRPRRKLRESDYLLGVQDAQRLGALRFRLQPEGPFLDDRKEFATPPWTSLRELEQASRKLQSRNAEQHPEHRRWLNMLVAPGGSLGGARPKAGVLDPQNGLWIAKFPGSSDDVDVGAWEFLVHRLAQRAGIWVSAAQRARLSGQHHTFLVRRFDRTEAGQRIHFASALTLCGRADGYDASLGASYLELAEVLVRLGAEPDRDLEQLWRRILFNACVSNLDDHMRNHGYLLTPSGWRLSPAYDMNPDPVGEGLKLNISETDNAQDLELIQEVAPYFRVPLARGKEIQAQVIAAVQTWRAECQTLGFPRDEVEAMAPAFRLAG